MKGFYRSLWRDPDFPGAHCPEEDTPTANRAPERMRYSSVWGLLCPKGMERKVTDDRASEWGPEEWEGLWQNWGVFREDIANGRQQVAKVNSGFLPLAMIKTVGVRLTLLLQITIELDKVCATNVFGNCTAVSSTFTPAFCLEALPKPAWGCRAPMQCSGLNSRGNTGGSQGSEVSTICRVQGVASCVKEAQKSAQGVPWVCVL